MHAVQFAGFRHKARIFGLGEKESHYAVGLPHFILRNEERILARAKRKLDQEWKGFAQDQGTDPFGDHSRVEIHLGRGLPGRWTMFIYWAPGDSWAGMHLYFECFWAWPYSCRTVF